MNNTPPLMELALVAFVVVAAMFVGTLPQRPHGAPTMHVKDTPFVSGYIEYLNGIRATKGLGPFPTSRVVGQ